MSSKGIIIQARLNSSRLPGKVLLPFSERRSILAIIIETCKAVVGDQGSVVLATTDSEIDNDLEKLGHISGIRVFRGAEFNVLERFIKAANYYGFETVLRVCADNPFLQKQYLQALYDFEIQHYDYVSYKSEDGVPAIKTHLGLFAELVSVRTLKFIQQSTSDTLFQEHVTNYIYTNPELFKGHYLEFPDFIKNRDDLRFTCDTKDDFEMLRELYSKFSAIKNQDIKSLIKLVDSNVAYSDVMRRGISLFSK